MLKFLSFGSGSSGNCYLLFTDNDALIIDMGVGTKFLQRQFKEYGLPISMIKHILLTHDHADHVKNVGKLSTELNLPVYATALVHEGVVKNKCVRHRIQPHLRNVIVKDETFRLGDFEITPFSIPHDSSDNVGYKIVAEGVTFCLMTDVGHITDEIKKMIGVAEYLVIEANYELEKLKESKYPQFLKERIMDPKGHLSNAECGQAIVENATERLRHVWLCHLSDENNHPELARKTVEQVLRSYGIVVGKDFKLDILKRRIPTGIFELV